MIKAIDPSSFYPHVTAELGRIAETSYHQPTAVRRDLVILNQLRAGLKALPDTADKSRVARDVQGVFRSLSYYARSLQRDHRGLRGGNAYCVSRARILQTLFSADLGPEEKRRFQEVLESMRESHLSESELKTALKRVRLEHGRSRFWDIVQASHPDFFRNGDIAALKSGLRLDRSPPLVKPVTQSPSALPPHASASSETQRRFVQSLKDRLDNIERQWPGVRHDVDRLTALRLELGRYLETLRDCVGGDTGQAVRRRARDLWKRLQRPPDASLKCLAIIGFLAGSLVASAWFDREILVSDPRSAALHMGTDMFLDYGLSLILPGPIGLLGVGGYVLCSLLLCD